MNEKLLPNLDRGYAIVGGGDNRWRTEVRSILRRDETDELAYLTHECRAENVSSKEIFGDNAYEFVVASTWLGNCNLRSGSQMYGLGTGLPEKAYQCPSGGRVEIHCPFSKIKELTFDETLEKLRNPSVGRFFIKIEYEFIGERWEIYAPARFINFPLKNSNRAVYLQPISGYTLFYNGERFVITYVAVHIEPSACHIEFIAREPLPFLETKPKSGQLRRWLNPFQHITKKILRTDEFWKIYVVDGKAVIYQYE